MEINLTALLVSALVPLVLGFIWYHPKVFGTAWMKAAGVTEEQAKKGNMALIFGLTILFSLMLFMSLNGISHHDNFVGGALYYEAKDPSTLDPNSESGKWLAYYNEKLSASNRTFQHGAFHGFLIAGLFLTLPVIAINALFEQKGFKYIAINAGYWMVCVTIMGGIIAAWP